MNRISVCQSCPVSSQLPAVEGFIGPGFGPVQQAFAANFAERGDSGAACAVYVGGTPVVDIWAGDSGRGPWTDRTRSVVFSVSKGVTAVCLLMAVEQGVLDLDMPVAAYWPEFAAAGKATITTRQLLSHRAGLPAPDVDLTIADLLAWSPVTEALARQAPAWRPGSQYAYHALTVGWLAGEVLRRATGMRPAQWLAGNIAGPLHLDMQFGVHPEAPNRAVLQRPLPSGDATAGQALDLSSMSPLAIRALSLGGALDPTDLFGSFNRPEVLQAEIPAGGLVTSARSLARLYAAVVGEVDGVRLLTDPTLEDATLVQSEGPPFVGSDEGHRWGTGFMLPSAARPMLGPGSFGHDGAGGQLAFAHRGHRVGFAYTTNRPGGIPDERANALCAALATCLA